MIDTTWGQTYWKSQSGITRVYIIFKFTTYLLKPRPGTYFRTFLLRAFQPGDRRFSTAVQDDASYLLGRPLLSWLTSWLSGVGKLLHCIFSGRSSPIHVIHFHCPLFGLRHSCNTLLRNIRLICCQRSIHNMRIVAIIYPTPPLGQDMTQGQFWSGV